MKQPENPSEGGSYIRHEDGSLERKEGTEPHPGREAPHPKPNQQLDHDHDGKPGGSLPKAKRGVKETDNA